MNTRWLFSKYGGPNEVAAREAVVAQIDAWWQEFQAQTDQLDAVFSQKSEWDLPEWMNTHLQSIHPELMWEFGPADKGDGHRLVITPESSHYLRPLTETILQRAPKLSGWEFYAYRLPENVEMAQMTVEARTGGDLSDVEVCVSGGEHHRVDLCFYLPRTTGDQDTAALNTAFVATETLLGEECLDKWIGAIEVGPTPRAGGLKKLLGGGKTNAPRLIPLERLKETVDAVVHSLRDQLPAQPHHEWVDEAEWTMWELKPEQADDYPQQHDLFVGKSPNPELWMAAHSGRLFYSEQFSRCGETFCYVKIDGSQGLDEEKFADKAEIEDALDAVLNPQNLGCQIGGGTGLRYSYIDLALADLDRGIAAVRQRLCEGNVPRRSWILFFDSDLAGEWVGIHDDAPAPPMILGDE